MGFLFFSSKKKKQKQICLSFNPEDIKKNVGHWHLTLIPIMAKTGTINEPAAMTKVMAEQAAFAISCPARNAFAYLTEEDNAIAANFQHGIVTTKRPATAAIIMTMPIPPKNNPVAAPAEVSNFSFLYLFSLIWYSPFILLCLLVYFQY